VLLIHHFADGIGILGSRDAIHRHFRDGVAPGARLAAGFVIDVERETRELPALALGGVHFLQRESERPDDGRTDRDERPGKLVGETPAQLQPVERACASSSARRTESPLLAVLLSHSTGSCLSLSSSAREPPFPETAHSRAGAAHGSGPS